MDRRSLLAGIVGQGYSVVAAPALTDGAVPAQIGRTLAGGSDQAGQPKTPDGARSSDVVRRVANVAELRLADVTPGADIHRAVTPTPARYCAALVLVSIQLGHATGASWRRGGIAGRARMS